jgi:tetratricopeptide (TPR) repeat protein
MARAADYLLRSGMKKAAALAARDAVSHARGLLPAYVVGIRCALAERNKPRAVECTKKAIQASIRPIPEFHLKMVELKVASGDAVATDYDAVSSLQYLREKEPGNPLWAQMLGYVRFNRGGWEVVDSAYEMMAAIENGATNRTPFLVGAEASRLFGNYDRATDLLRKGLRYHPDDLALLNNLTYTLALAPGGSEEAMKYVPLLIQRAQDNPDILDTAAVACLRAGRLDDADRMLSGILAKAAEGTPPWFRARLRQAEVLRERARAMPDRAPDDIARRSATNAEAAAILKSILKGARGIPDRFVIAANDLLAELDGGRGRPESR